VKSTEQDAGRAGAAHQAEGGAQGAPAAADAQPPELAPKGPRPERHAPEAGRRRRPAVARVVPRLRHAAPRLPAQALRDVTVAHRPLAHPAARRARAAPKVWVLGGFQPILKLKYFSRKNTFFSSSLV